MAAKDISRLNHVIQNKRLIEIEVFENKNVFYCGICIKSNMDIWLLINYDFNTEKLDGFTIFRNSDVKAYALYKKKYTNIDAGEINSFEGLLNLNNIDTICSSIQEAQKTGVIAFFLKSDREEYFVGKIEDINPNRVILKLINKDFQFSKTLKLPIADIDYFSFYTSYEREINEKLL